MAIVERPAAIELHDVSLEMGSRSIVDGIDLRVAQGEWFALLGETGGGKTSLLRMIAGLIPPSRGSITLLGQNQQRIPPHRRPLAMVTQSVAVYDHLTVIANLRSAAALAPKTSLRKESDLEGQQVMQALGLGAKGSLRPTQLSGGERQRLAIARSLLTQRPILLMDEPFAQLDVATREGIRGWLTDWTKKRDRTVVLVTHDPAEAMEVADRIAVLDNGRIEQFDAPELLYRSPASPRVGMLFGRPCMQFFPWTEGQGTATRPTVGVRPTDWQVIERSASGDRWFQRGSASEAPEARGCIVSIRQVESSEWIELDVGEASAVRISQPLPSISEIDGGDSLSVGVGLRIRARHWHVW